MTDQPKPQPERLPNAVERYIADQRIELDQKFGEKNAAILTQGVLIMHSVVGMHHVANQPGISQTRRLQALATGTLELLNALGGLLHTAMAPESKAIEQMPDELRITVATAHQKIITDLLAGITAAMKAEEVAAPPKIILPGDGGFH